MSVIDLKKRVTSDWREMHQHLQSTDSFIYVSPRKKAKIGPVSMDVEVGDTYILPGSNEVFKIPSEGVKIKPGNSIVVYTHQNFKLRYNVFGIVTGKGQYIFKGCFLSTGKIDPGFEGCLKIGFFNGGCSRIILKPNEVFATVFFMNTDATLSSPLKNYQNSLEYDIKSIKWQERMRLYVKEHGSSLLMWFIAAVPMALYYVIQIIKSIHQWLSQM